MDTYDIPARMKLAMLNKKKRRFKFGFPNFLLPSLHFQICLQWHTLYVLADAVAVITLVTIVVTRTIRFDPLKVGSCPNDENFVQILFCHFLCSI